MTSNLSTVIEAEIIDAIPPQLQTQGNIEWVRGELAEVAPSELLTSCKEYFGISDQRIAECENTLKSYGVQIHQINSRLDGHDQRIAALETRVAVAEAVATERVNNQAQINQSFSSGINSAHQSATHAAASSSKGWYGYNPTAVFFVIVSCLFFLPLMLTGIGSLVNQNANAKQQQAPIIRGY